MSGVASFHPSAGDLTPSPPFGGPLPTPLPGVANVNVSRPQHDVNMNGGPQEIEAPPFSPAFPADVAVPLRKLPVRPDNPVNNICFVRASGDIVPALPQGGGR
jgi:hypothetical protein